MNQHHLRVIYRLIIVLLIFITLYCFLLLKPIWKPIFTTAMIGLLPFLLSGLIAYLLHPLVGKLESLGMKRYVAILLIYLLFFGSTGYAIYLGVPMVIKQMKEFSEQLPIFTGHYREWIHQVEASTSSFPEGIQMQIDERINDVEEWFNKLIEKTSKAIMDLFDFLFILLVVPFLSFYMLKDLDVIKRACWYMTPKKWRRNGVLFLDAVNESLGGYIRGQILVCAIIGVAAAITFGIIGIRYPILLGIIIAITNVIPYFGPLIGAFPVVAIALMSSVKLAIIAGVIVFVLQFIEGNILSPYIVGKSLHMHPLFIIAALIIGGEAFGIIGMIVSVPILAIIKIAIIHSRDHLIRTRQS
ncbi:AI-2E family transporter [Bacillus sp. FJAT-49732]|uniref:AI-2E family transporter n=1 Tax=Lederbergia citrisecunda TaxID=2833583 RepID=A0A942TLT6_9BACI|nr:AI-2E family transporter [Lederbergia citrisecunda]